MKSIRLALLLAFTCALVWSQDTRSIADGENIIHLKVYGSGQPVLIINGGPGMNSDGFQELAAQLGQRYQVIIYDQRGTGQSIIPVANSKTVTLKLMVADIEKIREYLELEQWIVLGHSFGGMLASYYATQHPERLTGLILSSSGGIDMQLFSRLSIASRLTPLQRDSLAYWNNRIAQGDTSYPTRLQRGKYLAPAYVSNPENIPRIAERLTQGNMRINALVYQDMRRIGFDCSEGLRNFLAPTLIIQGKDDLIDKKTAERALSVIPNASLILLKDSSHYGWLDRPQAFFDQIHSFISGI